MFFFLLSNVLNDAGSYLCFNSCSFLPQPELLKTLSDILAHGGNSAVARRQAGLQLKNRLTSSDEAVRTSYQQRWMALQFDVRHAVKNNILGALGSEGYRPSAAAQCVQYVASIELPAGEWPNLIAVLVANVTNPSSTEMCKEATLEAIGYICQVFIRSNTVPFSVIFHHLKRYFFSPPNPGH